MSKTTERNNELAALKAMTKNEVETPAEGDKSQAGNFNITKNRPLPDGFENPPCGEAGHKCISAMGVYNPRWFQLMISSAYEGQANPQKFPLGGKTYLVPLDEWVDAPPEVLVSLEGAVETHHTQKAPSPGDIALGKKHSHKSVTRKRFVYETLPSA